MIDIILPRGNEILYPEQWTKITNKSIDNIAPYYTISTYGRVYNRKTNTYLPQNIFYRKDKYITISLALNDGTHAYGQIHRLMMLEYDYIDNSDQFDVNHKDGVKYHNWIWNLEWVTHIDNMQHAWDNNLFKFGSDRENTVYDESIIHSICQMIQDGKSPTEVDKMFNFDSKKLYHNIKNGHCWTHISKQYNFNNAFSRLVFNDCQKEQLAKIIKANASISNVDALKLIGITKDTHKMSRYREALTRFRKTLE